MKIITINLPEHYLASIQILNDLGVYPSRSEAIRIALKDFLEGELKLYETLEEKTFKMIIKSSSNRKN